MARRVVTHVRHQRDRIIAVGNPTEWWSPRSTIDVAIDIESGAHTYHARGPDGRLVRITHDHGRTTVAALTSDSSDLLTSLPPC